MATAPTGGENPFGLPHLARHGRKDATWPGKNETLGSYSTLCACFLVMDGGRAAATAPTDIHRAVRVRARLWEALLHRGNLVGNKARKQ